MIVIKFLLASALFSLGADAWLEIHSQMPYGAKWKIVFERYCAWQGWDKDHLTAQEYVAAADEATLVLAEIKQEDNE